MCMKCEIKKALKGALADVAGLEVTEKVIGKATNEQLQELQAVVDAEKAIKKQLDAEYKAEIAPIREKYKTRLKELGDPVIDRYNEVCMEIQKDLGISDEDDVSIDMRTGEVTKEVIKKKESSNLH
ncbi:hypothetical protein V7183_10060 [Bacillus sp. JJ1127]|uniref:hypothetical protein n=1 Tax=Bacillus sp. JJ1127 TaxID=3122952 RepID=UPI002FFFD340